MVKNMKLGNFKLIFCLFILYLLNPLFSYGDDKIESVPLINLDELSPTFEEDKNELESNIEKNISSNTNDNFLKNLKSKKSNKVYVNLKALDKITAKTSSMKVLIGDTNFLGSLEITALKCKSFESENSFDTVAYLQVKDLSAQDNDSVFLFNGWTFSSNPTLQSIDHPVYDLWITGCDNV